MKKSLFKDEKANAILMLVGTTIGILILLVIVTLVSPVGYNVDNSLTVPYGSDAGNTVTANNWNINASMTNGSEVWSQLSPMLSTTALVAVVGILIAVLLGALSARR